MKSNCLLLKKVLLIGWIIFHLGQSPKAQTDEWPTLMEINDIGYYHIDSSETYVFYPICNDTAFCTDLQLQMYGYLWDFGKGRYSLEANPRMQFEENEEVQITLRVTGFKTIKDPDAKSSPIRPAISNCLVTDTLRGFLKVKAAKIDDRFPVPKVTILQPSHMPVPGKCVDYLIRFDIPQQCRLSGQFELSGGIKSWPRGGGWEINAFESSEEFTVEQKSPERLSIRIDKGKRSRDQKTLYLLVHGQFSDSAKLEDMFHLDITGKFVASDPNGKCKSTAVAEFHESKFTGSLDPPHLACGAPSQVKHGDRILWDIKVQNLGNAAESDIEITDTLPTSLDWDRVELLSAQWNGKDIEAIVESDPAKRILKWRLNNDKEPLLPGAYAQIQFYTYVNQDFPCPDLPGSNSSPCLDRAWAGRPIVHRVWTKFHGEQVEGGLNAIQHGMTNQETVVLCRQACQPDVTPLDHEASTSSTMRMALMGFAGALLVGVVIFFFYRSRRNN